MFNRLKIARLFFVSCSFIDFRQKILLQIRVVSVFYLSLYGKWLNEYKVPREILLSERTFGLLNCVNNTPNAHYRCLLFLLTTLMSFSKVHIAAFIIQRIVQETCKPNVVETGWSICLIWYSPLNRTQHMRSRITFCFLFDCIIRDKWVYFVVFFVKPIFGCYRLFFACFIRSFTST